MSMPHLFSRRCSVRTRKLLESNTETCEANILITTHHAALQFQCGYEIPNTAHKQHRSEKKNLNMTSHSASQASTFDTIIIRRDPVQDLHQNAQIWMLKIFNTILKTANIGIYLWGIVVCSQITQN